jgi:hypothetical protein
LGTPGKKEGKKGGAIQKPGGENRLQFFLGFISPPFNINNYYSTLIRWMQEFFNNF